MKKYFVVSDIHAKYTLLMDALKQSGFSLENNSHIVIFGGDALDRGDDGDLTIRFFESLIKKNRIVGVLGNHDEFLLQLIRKDVSKARFNMNYNGFQKTVQLGTDMNSFSLTDEQLIEAGERIAQTYPVFINWLTDLPIFLEFKNHVIVHGFLDFSLSDWRETSKHFAIWERGYRKEIPASFEKKLIFGHTPNYHINGQDDIIYDGKKIMIDGGAAGDRQINVLHYNETEL